MSRSTCQLFRAGLLTVTVSVALGAAAVTTFAKTSRPASTPASQPGKTTSKYRAGTMPEKPKIPPQHIVVQHILIGFAGSVPGKEIGRTREEAGKLANEILEMARTGADFDTLVKQWTDDSFPGTYALANTKVPLRAGEPKEWAREGMVPAFGNVGFELSPGNIGLAEFDPKASRFGWHIIKRLK
jgi:hypothetical protein